MPAMPAIRPVHIAFALLAALLGAALIAQIEGERGIAPIASSGDFEVRDIKVDVTGPNADAARQNGWRLAQRLGWRMLAQRTNGGAGGALSDGALDGIVSGIEVQKEEIGPNRYIATLAVFFDRARTGQIMGVAGQVMRSPPLLIIPVLNEGGAATTFEQPTDWQRAWALFRTADSAIDYVRTIGDRADPVLLNAGQINRRGRNWWRALLDQYGAADVIMPLARLDRSYPGGPVIGRFAARYGPDNQYIGSFTLRVEKPADIPQMMTVAVKRMDELYTQALMSGVLRPDPSLVIEAPVNPDTIGNAAELEGLIDALPSDESLSVPLSSYTVQFDTPTAASVAQGETNVRAVPGVRSAATSSLALGGVSVMQVSYAGPIDQLRVGLEARGYVVSSAGTTLRISGRTGASAATPAPAAAPAPQ